MQALSRRKKKKKKKKKKKELCRFCPKEERKRFQSSKFFQCEQLRSPARTVRSTWKLNQTDF